MTTGKTSKRDVVERWGQYFGQGRLEDWLRLMDDLDIDGDFTSINSCRKALKGVWVNIPDFLDAAKQGKRVRRFPNQKQLSSYTKDTRRTFPKQAIPKGSPLRALLRHIF